MNTSNVFSTVLIAAALAQPASALDILLTNDDGYDSTGVNALYDSLVAAGHHVTLVAPMTNQSGKSMSFNSGFGAEVAFQQLADPNQYFLEGTPVDTINAATSVLLADNLPDLVISGANHGQNVGPISNSSGTVGAALRALQMNIPAIAVSVGLGGQPEHYQAAAEFLVTVIDQLTVDEAAVLPWWCSYVPTHLLCSTAAGTINLPSRTGLNINYPSLSVEDIAGVAYTRVSTYSSIGFTFRGDPASGTLQTGITFGAATPTETEEYEDTRMLEKGFVTISPINPDLNADLQGQSMTRYKLGDLITEDEIFGPAR
ncbi:5'/3'-nucleotidase SurE [Oceanicoccus sagamiensis]|uniref:5'-nucleotidase n=1 Tax=Oceanicoccus sagamiensis TaxID=716816 RepID=A0A1X9NCY0_9GAMM|nr:5'/3'-nucleotidase SurE [Oceanicoccus sagamiensis]ARN74272.1 hypothetical protein BST96_09145 [Oceanicoccus sagamiensis]